MIIGSNVKHINSFFVYGNKSIKSIEVSRDNNKYSSHGGLLYNKSGKKMIACAPARKNVVIYDKCEKPGLIEGSNIETITLGKNTNDWYVNSLDRSFIGVMPNLKKITVKKGNKRYFTRDGVLFMRSGDGSNNGICLVKYPSSVQAGRYIIPDDVSSIMAYAFSYSTIGNLVIPENVTSLDRPIYQANIENITLKGVCAPETERYIQSDAYNPWSFWRGLEPDDVTAGNLKRYIFENDNAVIPSPNTDNVPSPVIGWTPDWHPGHVVICSRANSTAHRYAIENGLVWEELS